MTLDSITQARLKLVYPDVAVRFVKLVNSFYELHRLQLRAMEGMRTFAYQEKLYAQGRTAPGVVVTNAKPGDSIHHYGLALDAAFLGKDPYLEKTPLGPHFWDEYGRLAQGEGFVWGGNWNSKFIDRPHVQLTYGLTLPEIKDLYSHGGQAAVWAKIDSIRGLPPGSEWMGPQPKSYLLETGAV